MSLNPLNPRSPHFKPSARTGHYLTQRSEALESDRFTPSPVVYDAIDRLPASLPAQMLQPVTAFSYAPAPGARAQSVPVKPVELETGPSKTERILDFLVAQQREMAKRAEREVEAAALSTEELAQVQGIVEQLVEDVEVFCSERAPAAFRQLRSARKRLAEGDEESLSHCATSCRRALKSVADELFPPQTTPHVDRQEREREVGEEQYLNRLLAYIELRLGAALPGTELTQVAATLDALYATANKGVHADVSRHEAERTLLRTYLVLGDALRAHSSHD